MLKELLLRLEWHLTFGWNEPFPKLGKVTAEDIEWAKSVIRNIT